MLNHDPEIEKYCIDHSKPLPDFLNELDRETHLKTTMPRMLSGSIQGSFLKMMASLVGARYIVEVGTFTGYSAICMALGMPAEGRLISLEVDEEMRPFHNKYFPKAGVENKIEVKFGDAMELIPELEDGIDLVFIDADKKNYPHYYDMLLPKVRQGGLILADNVLWSGKVLQDNQDKNTEVLKAFNKKVTEDPRVENFLSYIRDGLMMCRKC